MGLYEDWREAVKREASGVSEGGTRATYLEWLNEQQVLLLRQLLRLAWGVPEEVPDEAEGEAEDET